MTFSTFLISVWRHNNEFLCVQNAACMQAQCYVPRVEVTCGLGAQRLINVCSNVFELRTNHLFFLSFPETLHLELNECISIFLTLLLRGQFDCSCYLHLNLFSSAERHCRRKIFCHFWYSVSAGGKSITVALNKTYVKQKNLKST